METLRYRERKVIELYYGFERDEPQTLEEIGQEMKISRERVRQIKDRAIFHLKRNTYTKILHECV